MNTQRLARRTLTGALGIALVTTVAQAQLDSQEGPMTGRLGSVATIDVPAGYGFVSQEDMPALNAMTGNLHNPNDIGAIYPLGDEGWLLFFSFDPVGYVPDDDSDELDSQGMLTTFKEGDEYSNRERRQQGMPELHTLGWSKPPYYDAQTHNLTWGLRLSGMDGEVQNHQVRVLGRRGVMEVILAAGPEEMGAAVASLDTLLEGFEYLPGETYAEYRAGDRVAEYGLAGLVLGGGFLAAAKTGLLAKLGKFLKPLLLGVIALFATVGRSLKGIFSRSEKVDTRQPVA